MKFPGVKLVELAQHAGVDDLRFDYSGRFMFGKSCFGIVGGPGDLMRFATSVAGAAFTGDDEALDLNDFLRESSPSTDSMGRSTIYYWESLQAVGPDGEPFVYEEEEY
jgi:hypothetical protein